MAYFLALANNPYMVVHVELESELMRFEPFGSPLEAIITACVVHACINSPTPFASNPFSYQIE